ncbi:MAG: site-2 protease family protein [Anaerolineae bacterium]
MTDTLPDSEGNDDVLWLRPLLSDIFEVEDLTSGLAEGKALRVRGRLLLPAAEVYERLLPAFDAHHRTLLLRHEQDRDIIVSLDWVNRPKPDRIWPAILLAGLTVISVVVTYMLNYVMRELSWDAFIGGIGAGVQFALALLAILTAHEMGHYLVARRFGVAVSPPYLIPLPLSPFGTMGAVIRMRGIPPSRRAMLLTGAAGPLAGLAVCMPILIAGLALSDVLPLPQSGSYVIEGNSVLYAVLKYLLHGQWLPSATHDLFMHPLAFAGWAGLLVTGFNLIPAGQLDGGHVAYAWLGHRARYLTWAVIGGLLLMGLVWPGWILWGVLILFLSRGQQEPLENITPLSSREVAVALLLLVLFAVTIAPVPLRYIN